MTYTKPTSSFFFVAVATTSLMWPATSYAQDCDFWTGECTTVTETNETPAVPSGVDEGAAQSACDFWSGECSDLSDANQPSEQKLLEEACDLLDDTASPSDKEECAQADASSDSFWTQSHSEEVERRRVAEVARIEAERQAELRRIEIEQQAEAARLAEIKAARRKRRALEREREKQREEARREERRLADARRRSSQPRAPSTSSLILGALQTIERDLGREVNKINAENARRRAENERFAAQRRAQEQARQDREFDAKIAALEKQERDAQRRADLKAARDKQYAQRLERELAEQARQKEEKARQQRERARALTASRASRPSSSGYSSPSSTSQSSSGTSSSNSSNSDGCWDYEYQCVYKTKPRWDSEGKKFSVTLENRCNDRVYVSYCLPKKSGYDGCEASGIRANSSKNAYNYNATGEFSGHYWGSSKPSQDWVCKDRSGGTPIR